MKIAIAIDSFKGSLSSIEAGEIVQRAAREIFPDSESIVYPIADGGEGTVDALTRGLDGKIIRAEVTDPLGSRILSRYGLVKDLAIIEMADASGLTLVPIDKRNPLNTTTYGLGELILHAARESGARKFLIGIGGSATNDLGIGMLSALSHGEILFGRDLENLDRTFELDPILRECEFRIACDVDNPLTGENGCSAIYAPQKGATPEIVRQMDSWIEKFARRFSAESVAGDGAAGGLGFAFRIFLDGKLVPGINLVLDTIGIDKDLKDADILVTGEGRIDHQTSMGKAPVGIATRAKNLNPKIVTIGLCGSVGDRAEDVNSHGIDAFFPILRSIVTLKDAMKKSAAEQNLYSTALQIFRLIAKSAATVQLQNISQKTR